MLAGIYVIIMSVIVGRKTKNPVQFFNYGSCDGDAGPGVDDFS